MTTRQAAGQRRPAAGRLDASRADGGRRHVPFESDPSDGPRWRQELRRLRRALPPSYLRAADEGWPPGRQLLYIIDVAATRVASHGLVVELATQAQRKDGSFGAPKRFGYGIHQWLAIPDPADREIAQMLIGARDDLGLYGANGTRRFELEGLALETVLARICATGRCRMRPAPDEDLVPVTWDSGGPWELALALEPLGEHGRHRLVGRLRRDGARVPLDAPALLIPGLAIVDGAAAPFDDHGAFDLVSVLRSGVRIDALGSDVMDMLAELFARPASALPPIELPESSGVHEVRVVPRPRLTLRTATKHAWQDPRVEGTLTFDYGGVVVAHDTESAAVLDLVNRRIVHRDRAAESAAVERMAAVGFRREYDYAKGHDVLRVAAGRVARVVGALSAAGWDLELEGRLVRTAGSVDIQVRSGVDWFDLEGIADFDGVTMTMPELLAAVRRGERTLLLSDGSLGLIPDEWLERYAALAAVGDASEGAVRFTRGQVALLDALLAALPAVHSDAIFEQARAELTRFEGVAAQDPPPGFVGELRPYQREGLGWLDFLRRFGFGGCLADDMGLGKTVQVLALLEARRQAGAGASLVVVPRSLVFNWQQEAARFTPQLRVLVHAGTQRRRSLEHLADYDLVITTYGTLRRDVVDFDDVEFDYAILDEAQAIKNANTATAKAARLLRARHRLAMSGTPIENRLAELWSLFEFLNPGMLGAAPAFQRLTSAGGVLPDAGPGLVARAVRPFILRRTKDQVARDLPEREEQTLWVELGPTERRLYDELRDHYRAELLGRIESGGMAKAKMHVLEALLRLRQAACHPGLIDEARVDESSSKIDVLLSRIEEAVAEGHKALVFSQFTSLLAIVRAKLDALGTTYEYLDGHTRDRQARVERFQTDPDCPLFLISLKAGGLGLNLTAADYVFLLDPWWNPAVEAQAIDRAHRIGQTRHVLAARLIARGTVEEKVIELQRSKRDLADAIVSANAGPISDLRKEDLEMLLE